MIRKHSVLIAFVLSLLLVFSIAHAERTVWYVHPDSALNTIQAGLDSCVDYDTVLVGPGIYYENIVWPNTQGIHLISELDPEVTIIDGDSAGSVIVLITGVGSTTIIKGFTIRNGSWEVGGGIRCFVTSPTIKNNKIISNSATYGGGGIACYYSSAIIEGNLIEGNVTSGEGGGIGSVYGSSLIIRNNTIINNSASNMGGGIFCLASFDVIANNTIMSNQGGGIACDTAALPSIDSCTISNNSGDGIYCRTGANPEIHYCNITDNVGFGVRNESSWLTVDADSNWWGDASGPYHSTNPGGLGDTVSDYVDFDPWLSAPIGIYEYKPTPKVTFELKNKPNPFRNRTIIYYSFTKSGIISLKVYDQTGRLVKTLENGIKRAGNYMVNWNGYNNTNQKVPAGVYFTMLKSGDFTSVKKIIFVR